MSDPYKEAVHRILQMNGWVQVGELWVHHLFPAQTFTDLSAARIVAKCG